MKNKTVAQIWASLTATAFCYGFYVGWTQSVPGLMYYGLTWACLISSVWGMTRLWQAPDAPWNK